MTTTEQTTGTTARRIYTGTKDTGEPFAILYRPKGVEWVHGEEAQKFLDVVPAPKAPAQQSDRADTNGRSTDKDQTSLLSDVAGALNAAASLAGSHPQTQTCAIFPSV